MSYKTAIIESLTEIDDKSRSGVSLVALKKHLQSKFGEKGKKYLNKVFLMAPHGRPQSSR
jgi:linker histone H1 and H5 family